MKEEFPQEFYIEIQGDAFRVGRLTLNKVNRGHNIEIDIVQKDSKKIWRHVDVLYNIDDKTEAIDQAVQRLSFFLKNPHQSH